MVGIRLIRLVDNDTYFFYSYYDNEFTMISVNRSTVQKQMHVHVVLRKATKRLI
jgi:hypothetical protein